MPTITHMAMGYDATRTDEALTIHRVPIFVTCSRGEVTFDDAWVKQAVERAKQAEREGYYPPLHIRHHEPATDAADSVRAAGYFRIIGTAPITFKGSRRTAIMADLVITDPGTQYEVLAKRLPYRSVEIFNVEQPAIDGLALLDHEAPFLELPMLMVSDLDDQQEGDSVAGATFCRPWVMDAPKTDGPMVACFRRGNHAHLLFREGPEMADQTTNLKSDESDDDEKQGKMEAGEGTLDVSAIVKAIGDGSISVADMDAILAAIQGQSGEEPEEADDEGAANTPAPAAAPGGESMRKGDMGERMAAMQGQNEALRADIDTMKADTARVGEISAAMEKLEGRPLGADLENRLLAFHKEHGAKAFTAYVDGLASTVGVVPDESGKGAAFQGQVGKVPECAMNYQDQGADAVDHAATFAREWDELRSHGGTRVSQDRYVELNMTRAAAAV